MFWDQGKEILKESLVTKYFVLTTEDKIVQLIVYEKKTGNLRSLYVALGWGKSSIVQVTIGKMFLCTKLFFQTAYGGSLSLITAIYQRYLPTPSFPATFPCPINLFHLAVSELCLL